MHDDANLMASPMASTTMTLCAHFTGLFVFPLMTWDLCIHSFTAPLLTVRCGHTHKTLFVWAPFVRTYICIRLRSVAEPLSAVKAFKSPGSFSPPLCSWIYYHANVKIKATVLVLWHSHDVTKHFGWMEHWHINFLLNLTNRHISDIFHHISHSMKS